MALGGDIEWEPRGPRWQVSRGLCETVGTPEFALNRRAPKGVSGMALPLGHSEDMAGAFPKHRRLFTGLSCSRDSKRQLCENLKSLPLQTEAYLVSGEAIC